MKLFQYISLAFIAIFTVIVFGCTKEVTLGSETVASTEIVQKTSLSNFAEILSAAVYNEPELRKFIKQEALKEFDRDYEIFYPFVKELQVYDGVNFRELLQKYDSQNNLSAIEEEEPLLTVLVPDWGWVDPDCFSINNWDTLSSEIFVTYTGSQKKVPLYNNGKYIGSIKGSSIPSAPILIVKRNERIVYNPTKNGAEAYEFWDPAFDGSREQENRGQFYDYYFEYDVDAPNCIVPIAYVAPRVRASYSQANLAYNMPQRDYIYYDMTATKDSGFVDFHYAEKLFKFKLSTGNVPGLYDDTVAGTDAVLEYSGNPGTSFTEEELKQIIWDDSNLELLFHFIAGSREYQYLKTVHLKDLFTPNKVHFRWYQNFFGTVTYRHYDINPSDLVAKWIVVNWNLFTWDLHEYPTAYCIKVEEVDSGVTTTETYSANYKYSTNFSTSSEYTDGPLKIGYASGSSNELTENESVVYSTKNENDVFGQTWVHYTDPIITGISQGKPIIYKYSTGYVDFLIIPTQLY